MYQEVKPKVQRLPQIPSAIAKGPVDVINTDVVADQTTDDDDLGRRMIKSAKNYFYR